jgi:threonyl-tRNA synthetase
MGARIYNTLIAFIKEKYLKYGYDEVITPILYRSALWKKSGHWQHFKYTVNILSFLFFSFFLLLVFGLAHS